MSSSSSPSSGMRVLQTHVERVQKKQRTAYDNALQQVDHIISLIEDVKAALLTDDSQLQAKFSKLTNALAERQAKASLGADFRELYASVTKLGKQIDRKLNPNLDRVHRGVVLPARLVAPVLLDQFHRDDRQRLAETFVEEGKVKLGGVDGAVEEEDEEEDDEDGDVQMQPSGSGAYAEMHTVVRDLRRRSVSSCFAWTAAQHAKHSLGGKRKRSSAAIEEGMADLEFQLHRLEFLRLLWDVPVVDGDDEQQDVDMTREVGAETYRERREVALAYSAKHLARFGALKLKEVKQLGGCMLFCKNPAGAPAPYSNMYSNFALLWEETVHFFSVLCCRANGLPERSPLRTCLDAAALALPKVVKFYSVVGAADGNLANAEDGELPVEIDLGKRFQFHSTFICPVSREQSTPENPPVRLVCGHVLAKDSMKRIARTSRSREFKCPYCPQTQRTRHVQDVVFST